MAEVKLLEYIREYRNERAIVHRDKVYTYSDLVDKIAFWDSNLPPIAEKMVVGVESDFSPFSIALILNLISRNLVIAPLDIKQQSKNAEKYSIAQLDYLVRIDADGEFTIEKFVSDEPKNQFYQTLYSTNSPGLVLFTSGSSGKPKAAVHDLHKLLKKFEKKRKAFVTVNFLLFDHWGGLNTMFHILANGGLLVLLAERSPDYVCALIDKYEVELLPASPTFLNLLIISRAHQRYSLQSLKLITYGSEPMPENLLTMLNKFFPNVQLQQTYGLIELGVLSSKSENNNSLWVKIGGDGYALRVNEGLLEIKADSAMLGYINAPSPYTADGWFMTGDAVEVNGDYFRILGRKSELINVGGEKVYPQEVENVILEHENVDDVFIYAEPNPLTGKMVCAKITAKPGVDHKELIQSIKKLCRAKLASFKVPMKITITDEALHGDRFKKVRRS